MLDCGCGVVGLSIKVQCRHKQFQERVQQKQKKREEFIYLDLVRVQEIFHFMIHTTRPSRIPWLKE